MRGNSKSYEGPPRPQKTPNLSTGSHHQKITRREGDLNYRFFAKNHEDLTDGPVKVRNRFEKEKGRPRDFLEIKGATRLIRLTFQKHAERRPVMLKARRKEKNPSYRREGKRTNKPAAKAGGEVKTSLMS